MLQLTTIVFLITSSVLAVIHNIATKLFLYWHIWWLDIPVHAFGGMIVSLGLFTLRDLRLFPNAWLRPSVVLPCVLGVALIWEAYELIIGVPVIGDYVIDTSMDVIIGCMGGVVGYIIGNSLRHLR